MEKELVEKSPFVRKLLQVRDQINAVSPTFCLAKWLQTTAYLHTGFTHSCHHPVAHHIPKELIEKKPDALHNTPIKIVAREEMLKGVQTKECDYCWAIENLGVDHISDRTYKSGSDWATPFMDRVLESGLGETVFPSYLEVCFENTCNFRCTYCSPDISSRIMEDSTAHGPYKLSGGSTVHDVESLKRENKIPIHRDDYNPYTEAFWKWWPELYQKLHTFRITGGEPLLSKHTWRVLDEIVAAPRADLHFAINSNMGVPRQMIERLVGYINRLEGKLASFVLFTSCEAYGAQAEYIRDGMIYDEFMSNVQYVLDNTNVRVSFMMTTNLLSACSMSDFLMDVMERRSKLGEAGVRRLGIMNNYLRHPTLLNVQNLDEKTREELIKEWELLAEHYSFTNVAKDDWFRLHAHEVEQIHRLRDFAREPDPRRYRNLIDFYLYHKQYDVRRKKNLLQTFPELTEFWAECQVLAQKHGH